MGCQYTKPLVSPSHQADVVYTEIPASSPASQQTAAASTLLPRCGKTAVDLPTVHESVVKPNRPEWVMTSRDADELAGGIATLLDDPGAQSAKELDNTERSTDITLTENSGSMPLSAGSLQQLGCADSIPDRVSTGPPADSQKGVKSQRRVRTCPCDCCESDPKPPSRRKRSKDTPPGPQLEDLIWQLFHAHDLNGDNLLDEQELIKLNEGVAKVHDNEDRDFDVAAVREKYSKLFREKLDSEGNPVRYEKFRDYILALLSELDSHEDAQEMLMEQFLVEARIARTVVTGAPLLVDTSRPKPFYPSCLQFCKSTESASEFRR